MQIDEKFLKTLQQHHLIPPGSRIVVAVSGGADSLALLHLLYTHQSSLDSTLHIATLDHELRGEAGAEDVRFVIETSQALGLEVTAGKANVPVLAQERGLGIEAAARIARYDFLAEVAQRVSAERIAVAHHADDQAETVLMHLLRGSGLDGLAGMGYSARVPGHADLTLIRPLLNVSRAEIEAYCREHNLHPRQDITNEDITYTRNRLRHEVLPYLETLYPQVKRSLVQLADIASVDNEYVEDRLENTMITRSKRTEGRITISKTRFAQAHSALQRRFIRWAAQQLGVTDDLGYEHIISAIEIVLNGKQGVIAQLLDGVRLRMDYGVLIVEREDAPFPRQEDDSLLVENGEIRVIVPGVTYLHDRFNKDWELHAEDYPTSKVAARLVIPPDGHILLRTRRQGDHFAPLGRGGHTQKIGKWMIDHKIPRGLRDAILLLEINGEIAAVLWGSQWAVSEHYSIRHIENRVIYLWLESPN